MGKIQSMIANRCRGESGISRASALEVTIPPPGTAQPWCIGMRSRDGIEHERGIMSESYGPVSTSPDAAMRRDTPGSASTGATDVKDTAKAEASRVVETAKEEAGGVAAEAKSQARTLYAQTKGELREQAEKQQQRAAEGLRSASDELRALASGTGVPSPGLATDLVREASTRVSGIASWLGDRDPESLLAEVKSYARRRPGMFIGIALVAGVVAGRLTRALAEGSADRKSELGAGYRTTGVGSTSRANGQPAADSWTPAAAGGVSVGQFDDAPVGESLAAGTDWSDDVSGEGVGDERRNTNPL
jgi:hypothetical protein